MTQRNPMNDRYREENRGGKTRKSAASAKPTAERAATVRDPAPKTKKQKKEEARERERKRNEKLATVTPDSRRFESLPEYKKLRRIWWVCLVAAMLLIVVSFMAPQYKEWEFLGVPSLVGGYVLVIIAFYIDLGKIRKLRRGFEETVVQGKSKEARAAQKKARADARAAQKEAEENAANAPKEESKPGFLARFRKQKPADEPAEKPSDTEKPSEKQG